MFSEISTFSKIFHFLPIIPVYFVISVVTISVTQYFILDNNSSIISKYIFGSIFYFYAVMVLITHLKSMCTSPGYVYYGYKNKEEIRNENISQNHLYCKKCQNDRPPRSHHCKICRKCTLKMDHHCPWIANCVGFANQKFFYQFLFYAAFGDLIGFFILISRLFEFSSLKNSDSVTKNVESVSEIISLMWKPIMIILSSVLAIGMTISIGLLFYFQTKMIIFNQTTIENRIFDDPTLSPWYYPNKLHNFKTIMGNNVLEWFFPITTKSQYNGGYIFYTPDTLPDGIRISKFNTNTKSYMQLGDFNDKDQNHREEKI